MRGRGPAMLGRKDEVLAPARDQKGRALREARRSGFLSLPARNLTEFPVEAYHLEEHMDKDEKKWECVDLVKMDLSHNAITSIGEQIGELTTLTSIKLAQNALTTLPDELFQLTVLVYLDLSHNQLHGVLSESVGALVNLKELGLAANKLTALPESLAALCSLEVLRVEENALARLPHEIGQLTKLHTLSVHSNQLTSLPASFGGLTNLQTLDMKKNRLETMSEQLATLPSLTYLDLRQNKLAVFPQLPQRAVLDQVFLGFNALAQIDEKSVLRAQDSITVLDLRDNKLSCLPANMACLYKLKTLDVSNNDLSDLPPGLGYLKHLNHIMVDGNPLRSIRRGVISGGCETLKKYLRTRGGPPEGAKDVMEQEIDELQLHREREQAVKAATATASSGGSAGAVGTRPLTAQGAPGSSVETASMMASNPRSSINFSSSGSYVFRDAAASGTLDLTNKVLQSLPQELLTLNGSASQYNFSATLLHLNLSKNHLTTLPADIGELQALLSLTVEENQLRFIDPAIASLPRLQWLRLRKNQLTSDAVNSFLSSSSSSVELSVCLKELDLRNNLLTEMPLAIRQLSALETLQLAVNRIETLDGFPWQELRNTSVISVSDNKLKSLGHIYLVPLLMSLSFENNNLTSVPCELALCPRLQAIYMNGNPQKTVRGGIIAKGSLEILTYLKNKLPPNAALTCHAPPVAPIRETVSKKPTPTSGAVVVVAATTKASVPSSKKKYLSMYAATADEEGDEDGGDANVVAPVASRPSSSKRDSERPVARGSPPDEGPVATNSSSVTVFKMDKQIAQLEIQLESHALSQAKRFALKKELALARSAKIREERRLASSS